MYYVITNPNLMPYSKGHAISSKTVKIDSAWFKTNLIEEKSLQSISKVQYDSMVSKGLYHSPIVPSMSLVK